MSPPRRSRDGGDLDVGAARSDAAELAARLLMIAGVIAPVRTGRKVGAGQSKAPTRSEVRQDPHVVGEVPKRGGGLEAQQIREAALHPLDLVARAHLLSQCEDVDGDASRAHRAHRFEDLAVHGQEEVIDGQRLFRSRSAPAPSSRGAPSTALSASSEWGGT